MLLEPNDRDYYSKIAPQHLEWALQGLKERKTAEYVAKNAREAAAYGMQVLLSDRKISELEQAKPYVDLSVDYFEKAKVCDGSVGAMWADLSIAYGVQALLIYEEYQRIFQKHGNI